MPDEQKESATPLPCPFCGAPAKVARYGSEAQIICSNVDAKLGACPMLPCTPCETLAVALTRWNTRVAAPLASAPTSATEGMLVHARQPEEHDAHLLGAWTPASQGGPPPYINATMIRRKGDVVLTVRLPHPAFGVEGATSCVRFTRETWRAFVEIFPEIVKVAKATDYLDGL